MMLMLDAAPVAAKWSWIQLHPCKREQPTQCFRDHQCEYLPDVWLMDRLLCSVVWERLGQYLSPALLH